MYGWSWWDTRELRQDLEHWENRAEICYEDKARLEIVDDSNKAVITGLTNQLVQQSKDISKLTSSTQQIIEERDRYLSIFKRHDLTKLSRAKPGLIENRINAGTVDVFKSIEKDTQDDYEIILSTSDPNSP